MAEITHCINQQSEQTAGQSPFSATIEAQFDNSNKEELYLLYHRIENLTSLNL